MPVSHENKFVFVHIPKAGGSSIEKAFGIYGIDNKGLNDKVDRNIMFGKDSQHYPYGKILTESDRDLSSYFSFAFVRNPWSKIVSEFFWRRCWDKRIKDLSLKQFARRVCEFDLRNPRVCYHFLEQFTFIYNEDRLMVDFVGKFENLQQDLDLACELAGITKRQLPHTNKSNHEHYSQYYDDETRSIVAEKYAKDIEYFNYKFGE
jgi:hypothetical protein